MATLVEVVRTSIDVFYVFKLCMKDVVDIRQAQKLSNAIKRQ